ncbi:hypothetical protein ACIBI4_03475 [Streptomyces sp. NPDC050418]|uniref:hypothetical protein n=1 Tax=Streptomyces sp. NPDC050418 TaxID=3365612 RepID=UPI00378EE56E
MEARHAAPRGTRNGKGGDQGREVRGAKERSGASARQSPEMTVAQVSGSALGVVSGALLASALGLFGTVAGAVIFSLTATVGGSAFQLGLHRTGRRCRALHRPAGRTFRRRSSARGDVQHPDLTLRERQRLTVSVGVDRRFLG